MSSLAKQLTQPLNETTKRDLMPELKRRRKMVLKNRLVILTIITALIVWAWHGTGFSLSFIYTGAANMTAFIFTELLPPDFSAAGRYIQPALQTLYMSFVGMIFAVVFSLVLGFMAAKNTSFHPVLAFSSRAFIAFLRAIPAIIWGMTLVVAFGIGSLAGTLALGLSGIGVLGKAFADVLEEIDSAQVEAVKATGASWFQTMGQGVWPQFKTGFVAWSLYKMDLNIREAAVLGLIGAGGIGYTLQGNINLFQYKQASVGIIMIFVLILSVEFTTAKIREKLL
ncbi:phosphonate ABC transporter, permease protein PhnE [Bacillus sp. A301a_S52]|nr:phosphonate ABC transporter, permease protein PhnE [Bacillus sp. A301a_S52]